MEMPPRADTPFYAQVICQRPSAGLAALAAIFFVLKYRNAARSRPAEAGHYEHSPSGVSYARGQTRWQLRDRALRVRHAAAHPDTHRTRADEQQDVDAR